MAKILLLEPHGDDALLSCSSLLRSKNNIDILTFSGRSSEGLEKFYPSIKSTHFVDSNDLPYSNRPIQNTHVVRRQFNEGKDVSHQYDKEVKEKFGQVYDNVVEKLMLCIEPILIAEDYDVLVYPVGLNHPYHIAVRDAVERLYHIEDLSNQQDYLYPPVLLYVDKPYSGIRYVQDMLHSRLNNSLEIFDVLDTCAIKKEEEIKSALSNVYPTEVQLLRFYSKVILESPDTYVYNSFSENEVVKKLLSEVKEC